MTRTHEDFCEECGHPLEAHDDYGCIICFLSYAWDDALGGEK